MARKEVPGGTMYGLIPDEISKPKNSKEIKESKSSETKPVENKSKSE